MRFYLIDRIEELNTGESIKGVKCWSLADDVFNEHFPGFPVVPGVLLIESMAQLLGVLLEKTFAQDYPEQEGGYPVLSMVHKAKFRNYVVPGDKCELVGTLKTIDINRGSGSATVLVDGVLMAEAELSFFIATKKDLPENKFMDRRKEFNSVIMLKRTQKTGIGI